MLLGEDMESLADAIDDGQAAPADQADFAAAELAREQEQAAASVAREQARELAKARVAAAEVAAEAAATLAAWSCEWCGCSYVDTGAFSRVACCYDNPTSPSSAETAYQYRLCVTLISESLTLHFVSTRRWGLARCRAQWRALSLWELSRPVRDQAEGASHHGRTQSRGRSYNHCAGS